jgi:hypothetical protein
MSTATFDTEAQATDFLTKAQVAAAHALAPAHALLDNSKARHLALELESQFADAAQLMTDSIATVKSLSNDRETRPEVLADRRRQLQADYQERHRQISTRSLALKDELEVALLREAIPPAASDTATVLAREEVSLALSEASDSGSALKTLLGLVEKRGDDLAAVAASDWCRLKLREATGDDVGFDRVRAAAAKHALTSGEPGRQRAT